MSSCACREAATDGDGGDRSPSPSVAARARGLASWALPGAMLALVPKCPVCLAGYLALATGVGVSVTTATYLRWSMIALSVAALAFLAIRLATRISTAARR